MIAGGNLLQFLEKWGNGTPLLPLSKVCLLRGAPGGRRWELPAWPAVQQRGVVPAPDIVDGHTSIGHPNCQEIWARQGKIHSSDTVLAAENALWPLPRREIQQCCELGCYLPIFSQPWALNLLENSSGGGHSDLKLFSILSGSMYFLLQLIKLGKR